MYAFATILPYSTAASARGKRGLADHEVGCYLDCDIKPMSSIAEFFVDESSNKREVKRYQRKNCRYK
jgi:hypothetical protein